MCSGVGPSPLPPSALASENWISTLPSDDLPLPLRPPTFVAEMVSSTLDMGVSFGWWFEVLSVRCFQGGKAIADGVDVERAQPVLRQHFDLRENMGAPVHAAGGAVTFG